MSNALKASLRYEQVNSEEVGNHPQIVNSIIDPFSAFGDLRAYLKVEERADLTQHSPWDLKQLNKIFFQLGQQQHQYRYTEHSSPSTL